MTQPDAPAADDRTARVLVPPTGRTPAVLLLHTDEGDDLYTAVELPSDGDGTRLFEVVGVRPKDAGTERATRRHSVLVRAPLAGRPPMGDCTCEWGTYKGHAKACRHLSALHALWAGGKL